MYINYIDKTISPCIIEENPSRVENCEFVQEVPEDEKEIKRA